MTALRGRGEMSAGAWDDSASASTLNDYWLSVTTKVSEW